ncbi:MAG: ribonuclease R family protein [Sphingomonadaceae bacterium]
MPRRHRAGLPTREQILDFLDSSERPAGKREIARAFGIKGQDRVELKKLLRAMADEGSIEQGSGRSLHKGGSLPRVTVLRVADADDSGDVWAVPERWEGEGPAPRLRVIERKGKSALGAGDRILARTEAKGKGHLAHVMKKLPSGSRLLLGVLHREGERLWLKPVEKKERRDLPVSQAEGAEAGDLVLAEKVGRGPRLSARVSSILGDPFAPRSFSLIAIHKQGIPHEFPDEALAEAERVAKLPLGEGREDLRHLPIVAIDPADARDHDDAVWAEADGEGGWRAIVAIADVSFYVRPGSALDKEARRRGNSVYFPDRVVPMLPEILSADVCSLKAGEDRAALACHLRIAKDGRLEGWRFSRAVIRVAANIPYEEAQTAIDGDETVVDPRLVDTVIRPLWACWRALAKARAKREPLELDLPERRIELDEKGRIMSVAPRERLDAHRLIEDYMIAANVAAAKALEAKKAPVMYRVHEPPGREKLVALKDYLASFEIEFTLGQVIRPATFNRIIERVRSAAHPDQGRAPEEPDSAVRSKGQREEEKDSADILPQIMEQILRTQTQAYYAPQNGGHFGLALGSYAHFTSPIRRYADLVVHRSLVRACGLSPAVAKTGLAPEEAAAMEVTGELISQLERRAMEAERDTVDRYVAAYLASHVGEIVAARITGVQPFGFFATVEGLGGDGLVPASTIGGEYYRYDEKTQTLTGEESGTSYAPGQRLRLRLVEASPVSGGLRFEVPDGGEASRRGPRKVSGPGRRRAQGGRARPGNVGPSARKRK